MTTYAYRKFSNMSRDAMMLGYTPGDTLCLTWIGTIAGLDPFNAAERVFSRHNQDHRPDGAVCPSMSVGDVVSLLEVRDDEDNLIRDGKAHALSVASAGCEPCDEPPADTITTEWWPVLFDRLRKEQG